jgi:hypothetical protein
MWRGQAEGGWGDDRRLVGFGGYETLGELLETIHAQVRTWEHLTDIYIRVWWRHPDARPRKPQTEKPGALEVG